MTSKQFVALGVRLFCVWLAIYILWGIPAYWFAFSQQPKIDAAAAIIGSVATGVLALLVLLLWLFPLTVAGKLLPRSIMDQPISLSAHEQIERAGFCLMGLWLLTRAVPALVYEAFVFDLYIHSSPTMELRPQDYAALAERLVELALAIWLLFGAKGLRSILRWARTAGSGIHRIDSNQQE